MGQISGINASSITNIAGVQVASISYVGPVSAAALGLGGGGKVFTLGFWAEPLDACSNGQIAIDTEGSQILYQTEDHFYTDSTFENPFIGTGNYYWCQTDNTSYAIDDMGGIKNSSVCPTVTGLVFALDFWDNPTDACLNGQKAIDKQGSQTLYQNGEILYVDAEFTTPFMGNGNFYWNQTQNISCTISGEGIITMINYC